MPDQKTNDYTVCIIFDPALDNVLLVRKGRTAFQNMLNGPGGAIEPGETPYDGAFREIYEETGLSPADFQPLGLVRLAKLGELLVPDDCKTNDGSACRLYYYAGAIKPGAGRSIRPADEPLEWMPSNIVMRHRTDSTVFAGHGDLAYFAAAGYKALAKYLPGTAAAARSAGDLPYDDGGIQGLTEAMNASRGRLDADFRRGDLFQAGLDAADVSKFAYAVYYLKALALRDNNKNHERSDGHAGPEAEEDQKQLPTEEIV